MISRDPDQILLLAGALIALVECVAIVHLRPPFGAALLTAAAVLQSFSIPGAVELLGVQVYLLDGVCIALLVAVLLRLGQAWRVGLPIVGLALLAAIAALRGISIFGTQPALNSARALFYPIVAITYCNVCIRDRCWETVQRLWRLLALPLVGVAAVFLLRHGLGSYASDGTRALNASQTLLLGQAAVIGLADMRTRPEKLFVAICFGVVFLTQQRTAWAATIAALAFVALLSRSLGSREVTRRLRIGLFSGFVAVIALLLFGPSGLRSSVGEATSTASTKTGTLGWRIDGWIALMKSFGRKPLEDKFIGQPAGTGFDRVLKEGTVTVSPHNMYLFVLLSLGVLGLVLFLVIVGRAIYRAHAASIVLFALLCGLLVYSVDYQLAPEQGLVIGAGLTIYRRTRQQVTTQDSGESLSAPAILGEPAVSR